MWAHWLRSGLASGRITTAYPRERRAVLAAHAAWRPFPEIVRACPEEACAQCAALCPTGAIEVSGKGVSGKEVAGKSEGTGLRLDLGACIGCGRCVAGCPAGTFAWSAELDLAAADRRRLRMESPGGGRT